MKRDLLDWELDDMYEEYLSEVFQPVSVCGYEYEAGKVLREVDPIAFRCGCADWLDNEITEGTIEEVDGKYFLVQ